MPYIFSDYNNMVGKRPRALYWREIHDSVNDLDARLSSEFGSSYINVIEAKAASDPIESYPIGITTFQVTEDTSSGYPSLTGVVETLVHRDDRNVQHFFTLPLTDGDSGVTYYRQYSPALKGWTRWTRILTDTELDGHVNNTDVHVTTLDHRRIEGYVHTQGIAASTWTIQHDLKKFPAVSIVDSAGSVVYGEVSYLSQNTVVITFSAAFSGTAYLN